MKLWHHFLTHVTVLEFDPVDVYCGHVLRCKNKQHTKKKVPILLVWCRPSVRRLCSIISVKWQHHVFSLSRRATVHCWVFRTRALWRHVFFHMLLSHVGSAWPQQASVGWDPFPPWNSGTVMCIRKCHRRRRGANGWNVSFAWTIPLNVWHQPDVSADALGPVTTNAAPTTRLGLVYKTPKGSTPLTSTLIRSHVHRERKPPLPSVAGSRIPSSRS